jgi:predicted CXXCH cytochrome family protein
MGTETNQLCLTCHDQMRPGMFRDGAAEHPLSPKVSPEQARAIQEMGTKLSPDEKLICLSCHKLHHGKGKRFMLADELQDAQLCLRCHAERKAMLGSAHDLRKDFPEEKNRLGMTPETGGPCSACHLFHRYARAPEFSEVDPGGGKCISCHQKGRVAEAKVLPPLNHPKAPCTGCHNPHHPSDGRFLAGKPVDVCSSCHADEALLVDGKHDIMHSDSEAVWPTESEKTKDTCLACHRPHGNQETGLFRAGLAEGLDGKESACAPCHTAKVEKEFNHPGSECKACHNPHLRRGAFILADKPSDLCSDCHAEKAVLAGGRHDISRSKVAWPAESVQSNDLCLACHRPHGDEKTGLFRAGLAEGVSGRDAGCVACHIGTEPKIGSQIALMHTSDGEKLKIESKLPMGCSPEGDRLILCRTCHNPHGGPDAAKTLLRIKPGEKEQQVCLDCHVDAAHIEAIGHGTEPLRAAGFETGACKPCHLVHAKAHSVEAKYLWPKQLAYPQDATPPVRVPDQPCRACHRTGGPVAPPAIATHPKADFFNPTPPASAGFLPLFNDRGEIDPQGSHACRTCHLTHGRTAPAPMPEGLGKASEREVRARQWHIRAFGSGNVCATCHGFDALRRFMYFHDAARRGGPIEKPPPVGG